MIKKREKNNFFVIILGGASTVVIIAFLLSALAIAIVGNRQSREPHPQKSSAEPNNISFYVVSGKIIDIQGKTISLETPVFDSTEKRRYKDKKEIRKMTIDNKTELLKESYKWDKEENEREVETNKIEPDDLKIGDYIIVNSLKNIAEVGNFTPTQLIVIPSS